MSVYNCCKQILEIERKDEEIMVQQDQISLMNEIHFRYLENIERLEKQLNIQKFKNCKSRLAFKRAVNIDIPPVLLVARMIIRSSITGLTETNLNDLKTPFIYIVIVIINNDHNLICYHDVK